MSSVSSQIWAIGRLLSLAVLLAAVSGLFAFYIKPQDRPFCESYGQVCGWQAVQDGPNNEEAPVFIYGL